MNLKNTFITLSFTTLIGLIASTTFLSYYQEKSSSSANDLQPDAFMENVSTLILNKQGKPSIKIITPKLTHFPQNDTTYFINPILTLYRQSASPWFISAKQANAAFSMDNIRFWDDVNIHHSADIKNPAILIKTNNLFVHPNQKTAETNDIITMIQPNAIIKATGLFADMKEGSIKLLSNASGEYVPNS